jgi:hypothetical protein
MALVAGAVPDSDFPNGTVMNAVGIKSLYRAEAGLYYLGLEQPIEFDVQPDSGITRPPFAGALPFAQNLALILAPTAQILVGFVPSDIPPVIINGEDMRGSLFLAVADEEGGTDDFLLGIVVLRFPVTGASGTDGVWPAIAGKPV